MLNQIDFGKRLKSFRLGKNLSQKEIAFRIGVSEQAVSKWEYGECLPDVYNLKLLAQILHISIDTLLDTEFHNTENIIQTVPVGGACFEIIEKPETIFAGKIIYAKDFLNLDDFHSAIDSYTKEDRLSVFNKLREVVVPIYDVNISINFWLSAEQRAFGFVREVMTEEQPNGIDVYKIPASLFIRAHTNKQTAQLLCKEQCEIWELFAYIRNFFMPAHGFKMAQNGAQELEMFDSFEHKYGYAYMPVIRI